MRNYVTVLELFAETRLAAFRSTLFILAASFTRFLAVATIIATLRPAIWQTVADVIAEPPWGIHVAAREVINDRLVAHI